MSTTDPASPRLSIATSFDYGIPIERQIPLIAAAGFTHVSLGGQEAHSAYLSAPARRELRLLTVSHGLDVDTVHGPRADPPDAADALARTADAAAELGAGVVVLHGGPFDFPAGELPERLERLLAVCNRLRAVAAATGVRFALENVLPGPSTDLVQRAVVELDDPAVGFCYDSSHDQIGGPRSLELLAAVAGRLAAVHLSDRVRDFVDHLPPGEGFVDWPGVAALLRRSTFDGPLLLEVATTHSAIKEPEAFLAAAYASGAWVHSLVVSAPNGGASD
jgi:sugar phosphate isomerase/epimerase